MNDRKKFLVVAFVLVSFLTPGKVTVAEPIGTKISYQGQLEQLGSPASGLFDFRVVVYDSLEFGNQISPVLVRDDVEVLSGLVNLDLDFGPGIFNGERRWLEIQVREGSNAGSYTSLIPRQEVVPSPYSLRASDSKLVEGERLLSGTIGTCLSDGNAGSVGSVSFAESYASPPRIFLTVDESFNNVGCTSARLTDRSVSGFSWKAFVGGGEAVCDCIHWLAIGPV